MRVKDKSATKAFIKSLVKNVVITIILIALFVLSTKIAVFINSKGLANFYCRIIFPEVAFLANSISSLAYFSLAEHIVILLVFAGLVLIISTIVLIIKTIIKGIRRKKVITLVKFVNLLLIVAIVVMTLFELLHGINYYRTPVVEVLDMKNDTTYEAYKQTLDWSYAGMIGARRELGEDYNGVAHMSTSFDQSVYDANLLLNAVDDEYDLGLSSNYIRAKAVMLSDLWSYTEITGVYAVPLGEANINTDYIDIVSFPIVLCHEICHAKGYAREYDCNMIAVVACIQSPRADFRYAGYTYIFSHLYGEVVKYAESQGEILPDYFADPIMQAAIRDSVAKAEYWDSLKEGFIPDLISRFSEDVNDAFLESNGQEGGTDTYHVHPDFYVNFYCSYVRGR